MYMKYVRMVTGLLFMTLLCNTAAADVTKEKKLAAHYTVQSADRLVLDNKFGLVHINTWDKNEVNVDITIRATAATQDKAEQALDRVSIRQEGNDHGGHRIYYKTNMATGRQNNSTSVAVDYVISMPRKMWLDITNKFGDIYVDDFAGHLNIDLSYGAFSSRNISGADKTIHVAYGHGNMSAIDEGTFDLSYSNFTIDKAQRISVKNVFGKLDIGTVQHLDIDQKYGNLDIGAADVLAGTIDYAGINVDVLNKSVALTLKYCNKTDFRKIAPSVNNISINAAYSSLYFHLERGLNMAANIDIGYGEVKNDMRQLLELDMISRTSQGTVYKGKAGTGAGNMILSMKYGNIAFR